MNVHRRSARSGLVGAVALAVLLGLFGMHGLGVHGVGGTGHGSAASGMHDLAAALPAMSDSAAAFLVGAEQDRRSGAELCVAVLVPRGVPVLDTGITPDATGALQHHECPMPAPRPCGRDPSPPSLEQLSVSRR